MHWAPYDNMGVDRPNGTRQLRLAISAVKCMFEQDDNDIVVETHLYPWKRFLAMTSTDVIPCEHPQSSVTRINGHFTKYMQYNSKAKQSIVKLFVHSSIYYLMFASKILFKCCSDQIILVFKLRHSFTSEISKKHS